MNAREVGFTLTLGLVPAPFKLMTAVPPVKLTVAVPVLVKPDGVNLMYTTQVPVTAVTTLPSTQPPAPVSAANGPVKATLVKVILPPVVLDKFAPMVTDEPTVVSGKESVDGVTETLPAMPVPCRLMTCGLVVELSVIVSVPARAPAADGVKAIGIVQDVPARISKQLLDPGVAIEKSLLEICTVEMFSACEANAELERVIFIVWLWVFTV